MRRSVSAVVDLDEHRVSAGFSARSLRAVGGIRLDPFLSLDEFRMSEPTFPPHPHAGFSAVTYMFEGSAGAFVNRDSLGDRRRIEPGAIHWTQAGRGMLHEEIPERRGVECHGMQIFVNLRASDELAAPRAFHTRASEVRELHRQGARIRVLAGEVDGVASALVGLATEVCLADVHLDASARLSLPLPSTAFALVVGGEGTFAGEPVRAHHAIGLDPVAGAVELAAGPAGMHLLVGGGEPLGEPVVFGGPFAMSSRAQVEEAFARFRRGEMGRLDPSF